MFSYSKSQVIQNILSRYPSTKPYYLAVTQLYHSIPNENKWKLDFAGYTLLCRDEFGLSFINIYDPRTLELIFQHELYYDFDKSYKGLSPCFYSFQSDSCIFGLNFKTSFEARDFFKQVVDLSPEKKKGFFHKQEERFAITEPLETENLMSVKMDCEDDYVECHWCDDNKDLNEALKNENVNINNPNDKLSVIKIAMGLSYNQNRGSPFIIPPPPSKKPPPPKNDETTYIPPPPSEKPPPPKDDDDIITIPSPPSKKPPPPPFKKSHPPKDDEITYIPPPPSKKPLPPKDDEITYIPPPPSKKPPPPKDDDDIITIPSPPSKKPPPPPFKKSHPPKDDEITYIPPPPSKKPLPPKDDETTYIPPPPSEKPPPPKDDDDIITIPTPPSKKPPPPPFKKSHPLKDDEASNNNNIPQKDKTNSIYQKKVNIGSAPSSSYSKINVQQENSKKQNWNGIVRTHSTIVTTPIANNKPTSPLHSRPTIKDYVNIYNERT